MRKRRAIAILLASATALLFLGASLPAAIEQAFFSKPASTESVLTDRPAEPSATVPSDNSQLAVTVLATLEVKGRAAKTGYARSEFGDGWSTVNGCTARNIILNRDMQEVVLQDECTVVSGVLQDPYTATEIMFTKDKSAAVQIDHVIALSDAWQKGAQQLTKAQRIQLANDPLELLAVDGPANQQKSDADAATWLPKNKNFRCTYVARQIAVKAKYSLWVTPAEHEAMAKVLSQCPLEPIPSP